MNLLHHLVACDIVSAAERSNHTTMIPKMSPTRAQPALRRTFFGWLLEALKQ